MLAEAERHRVDGNDAIFPGVTFQEEGVATLSNMALLMLLKRLRQPREKDGWALSTDVTAHGFRSASATGAPTMARTASLPRRRWPTRWAVSKAHTGAAT